MPSPLHGVRPPYAPDSNIVYFHDWRYVQTGHFSWLSDDGTNPGLFTRGPIPRMHLDYHQMPLGIRLIAQKATKTEPVITPEQAGEVFLFGGSLIHDEGVYRLWYECWPKDQIGTPGMGHTNYVRYAESDDGVTWRFPNLSAVKRNHSAHGNIVYGAMLTGEVGYHGGSIFKDLSAPPDERYQAFHLGCVPEETYFRYKRERPDEIDNLVLGKENVNGLFGATSPDGIHWTPIVDPLVIQNSDTHNVCEYDATRGKYVAYCRSWYFMRRTIGRTETDDFRHFPLPEELFWPSASMHPYDTWYANAKTMMPGTSDYHIMFPMRWSLPTDSFDFHLATSPDGIVWNFVPGGAVCEPGGAGAWDCGVVTPGLGLVDLPGNRIGILFSGSPVPHKHPRKPPLGKIAWATWPKGRLVALESPIEGSFALWPLIFEGREVHLNLCTHFSGYICVEAVGPDGRVLPGRSFSDCDPIDGDSINHIVTWNGESDLGHADGAPVSLRFRMRSAELFSVRFA